MENIGNWAYLLFILGIVLFNYIGGSKKKSKKDVTKSTPPPPIFRQEVRTATPPPIKKTKQATPPPVHQKITTKSATNPTKTQPLQTRLESYISKSSIVSETTDEPIVTKRKEKSLMEELDLSNKNSLHKAVIYAEIFNRKYK